MVKKKDEPKDRAKPLAAKLSKKKPAKKAQLGKQLERAPDKGFQPDHEAARTDSVKPLAKVVRLKPQQKKDIELIWLYCPHCQSLQYTAISSNTGRTHVVCNTPVAEKSLPLYAPLEYAMTRYNFDRAHKLSDSYRETLDEMDTIYNLAYVSSTKTAMVEFQKKIVEAYKTYHKLASIKLSEQRLDTIYHSKETTHWIFQALEENFIKDSYGFLHSPFFLFPLTHFLAN